MRRRDRWLRLAEVAELMNLPQARRKERRQAVCRLLRGLEKRDGTKYLRRFSGAPNAPLFVSVSALEQLMPWDPGTLTAMREHIDVLGTRVKRVERRVTVTEKDIAKLREFQRRSAELLSEMASWRTSE